MALRKLQAEDGEGGFEGQGDKEKNSKPRLQSMDLGGMAQRLQETSQE